MVHGRDPEIMPSVTKLRDGTTAAWRSLSGAEREEQEQKLCQRISERLSAYYAAHPDERKAIQSRVR